MRALKADGYDVLIAGTGMGGATLGYALARAGRRVLFVEQGPDLGGGEVLRGMPPEASRAYRLDDPDARRAVLIRCGRNPEAYGDEISGTPFTPFIGFGTGGSSNLYGMVLERRHPRDFEGWPVSYGGLAPWYGEAERLYEVRGSADPLLPGGSPCLENDNPISIANEAIFRHLSGRGLHPYRLHVASRRIEGCRLCQGYLCGGVRRCKNDARVTCLEPALATGHGHLLTGARVTRLSTKDRRVTEAVVSLGQEEVRLSARVFVLAAGALATPGILLASEIGNRTGLVGRRLMRHAIDLFVLAAAPKFRDPSESKELGLNDYYSGSAEMLGTVQSFGMAPPLEYLRNRSGWSLWRMLGPAAAPAARWFSHRPIVASILEDKPWAENRVGLGSSGPAIRYRLLPSDEIRRGRLRRKVMRAFARFAPVPVFGTSSREALGHVCGTAVFGEKPETSVLDPCNRVWDSDNLYVADSSFFPTSGGVNPALTIAANALRIASHLDRSVL